MTTTVTFTTSASFSAGSGARSAVVGDFNGDGKQDLAVANGSDGTVTVLLGNGSGSFSSASSFFVGCSPALRSIAVGDFNKDGKQDLVLAARDYGSAVVLLGDGSGSFSSTPYLSLGCSPYFVAVGDFNGDGKEDLVSANRGDNTVSLLLGDGSGSFGSSTYFSVGSSPYFIAVDDFNGDGKKDLAVANRGESTITVLLNDGSGSFASSTSIAVGTSPRSIAVGDFNGDGKKDLAVANSDSGNVSVLLGNGSGSFSAAVNYTVGSNPRSIVVGDFNGDGKLDLATANTVDNNVSVLLGNGSGSFGTLTNFTVGSSPYFLAVGDFDGDKKSDLLTANYASGNLSVLVNSTNFAPTDLELSDTTVDNKAPANTVVGSFTTTDPDKNDTTFTYSLVTGEGSTDNSAFKIENDQLIINNAVDAATKSSYNIRVRTTDSSNNIYEEALTIGVGNITTQTKSINLKEDIFSFSSLSAKVKIKIKIKARRSSLMNEMGCFVVDDDKGTINGIAPDAAGYAEAALERAKVIFSVVGNSPTGFNFEDLSRVLEFDSSAKLRFYMVKNSTTYSVKSKFTSTSEIIFSSVSTQKITTSEDGSFSMGWKDGSRSDSDFDDLQVSVEETDDDAPIGTNLQGNDEGEAIDCRSFGTDTLISGSFTVNREASFNNYVGFYQVSDEKGGIDINGDGTVDILPGETGYLQAAINARVSEIGLSVANQGQGNQNGNFKGGAIYVPFLIVNGGIDAVLDSNSSNDPKVYFTFLGANTDKTKHVRMLGDNCFGFEDLAGGGDSDYNDVIVKVDLKVSASFA